MKQQTLLRHRTFRVSVLNHSSVTLIFLLFLFVLGCKKGSVLPGNSVNSNSKVTQNYLQHKLDSLVQLAPKSVKINNADSTITTELQNGTIIKKKLTKFLPNQPINQTSKLKTQWTPDDGVPSAAVWSSHSWASLIPDVLGNSTSFVKVDASYMKVLTDIWYVYGLSQTFFGGSYQQTNADGSTTTELGVALLNAHAYTDPSTTFPAPNVQCIFLGDVHYQLTLAYPGLTPVTSTQSVSYAIFETIYP